MFPHTVQKKVMVAAVLVAIVGTAAYFRDLPLLHSLKPATRSSIGATENLGKPGSNPATNGKLGPMPRGKDASEKWRNRGWAMADRVGELVASDDPAARAEAMSICRELIDARPAFLTGTTSEGAIRFLLAKGMYRELIELADYATLRRPDEVDELATFYRYKATALANLNEVESAIVAGKQHYLLAPIAKTDSAVRLLASLLRTSKTSRAGQADHSIEEQARAKRYDAGLDGLSQPAEHGGVLASILVVSEANDPELADLMPDEVSASKARGALLLLAQRPDDAEIAFRAAYEQAAPKQLATCADLVARALRAQDGGVGRAAAWLSTPWPNGARDDPRAAEVAAQQPAAPERPHEMASRISASPAIQDWLRTWEKRIDNGEKVAADQASELQLLLDRDSIDSAACARLVRTIARFEPGENRSTAPFGEVAGAVARTVIAKGVKEIESDPSRRSVVLADMSPLVGRLWRAEIRDAKALEAFYAALASGQSIGSPDWTRGLLGRAENIGRQGRFEDSLKAFDELEALLPGAEPPLLAKLKYSRAVVLMKSGRYAQAIELLKFAVKTQGFEERPDALSTLMSAFLQSGQAKDMTGLQRQIDDLLPGSGISAIDALLKKPASHK